MENNKKQNKKAQKIKIGITHGDINGISYEIILKTFKDPRILELFTPIIYGSPKIAAYYKKVFKLSSIQLNHIKSADKADPNAINIINCVDNKIRVEIGQPTEMSGKAALDALKAAVADLKAHKIDALVTAPINKKAIYGNNFNFKGHTWYLAHEFGVQDVLMFMIYDKLRIAVATDHIPLKDVSNSLSTELILNKLLLMDKSLKTDFKIEKPIIAVLGLNPHAGDDGLIGDEEEKIIIPAIEKAKEKGLIVLGPYPADGFFGSENYKNFDAILALYHDQGLIPFKILSKGQGVNYTANLPFVRTSPAHGTAYDIAGLNKADHTSFLNAIYLAIDIYKSRKLFENIQPLEKQNMDELLYTLMPAKAAELQEMENVQKEDEQDQIKQDSQQTAETAQPQEQKQTEQIAQNQQPETTENQQPAEPETEKILIGDHPDVQLETIDENTVTETPDQVTENKQDTNKSNENNHHHNKTRHSPFKGPKRLFKKHKYDDYKDMT